jgi:multisubunit Na+/H+ antiporter MnhC subunit
MNGYLLSSTAVAVLIVIVVVAFMFVARRVLRVAIRLALGLTLVFAVLLTAGVGWWRGWFTSNTHTPVRQTARPTAPRR